LKRRKQTTQFSRQSDEPVSALENLAERVGCESS